MIEAEMEAERNTTALPPASTITRLPELLAALPTSVRTRAEQLLAVERVQGYAVVPPAMQEWVTDHFGGVERVTEQTILKVTNLATLEAASFNPLRSRRPREVDAASSALSDETLDEMIAASTGARSMFSDPTNQTTADRFGRIQGKHCVSASNIAKYDAWHGLVIFNEPHPLRFTRAQLGDYFDVALRWLVAAHQTDPHARYPLITWNCLWKGGASITHGHLQMVLSRGMAWGHQERQRRASVAYRARHHRSLSDDLWHLHEHLGLAFPTPPEIRGYATLTPIKDRDLVLMSGRIAELEQQSTMGSPLPNLDTSALQACLAPLWDAAYLALRSLIDDQGVRSFNLVAALPPFGPTAEPWDDWSCLVRMVDRGDPLSRLVNFGAMELFASSVITTDPFAVATALRETIPRFLPHPTP
ncbi:MAG: hypothetical protein HC884_03075 [Chloroflexaceae bacterium]|nr:hypothetical protein [Chloroflexaceae bacterium]